MAHWSRRALSFLNQRVIITKAQLQKEGIKLMLAMDARGHGCTPRCCTWIFPADLDPVIYVQSADLMLFTPQMHGDAPRSPHEKLFCLSPTTDRVGLHPLLVKPKLFVKQQTTYQNKLQLILTWRKLFGISLGSKTQWSPYSSTLAAKPSLSFTCLYLQNQASEGAQCRHTAQLNPGSGL